jgi:hypothetical protein
VPLDENRGADQPADTFISRYPYDPVSAPCFLDLWASSHLPTDEVFDHHDSSPPKRSGLSHSGTWRGREIRPRQPGMRMTPHRRRYPHFGHRIRHGIAHWKNIEPV